MYETVRVCTWTSIAFWGYKKGCFCFVNVKKLLTFNHLPGKFDSNKHHLLFRWRPQASRRHNQPAATAGFLCLQLQRTPSPSKWDGSTAGGDRRRCGLLHGDGLPMPGKPRQPWQHTMAGAGRRPAGWLCGLVALIQRMAKVSRVLADNLAGHRQTGAGAACQTPCPGAWGRPPANEGGRLHALASC